MYQLLILSPITLLLFGLLLLIVLFTFYADKKPANDETNSTTINSEANVDSNLPLAPGPKSYPIIGSMHLLGQYEIPYQAFGELAKTYGPIIRLDLGSVPSLIVNGQENIREVLFVKGTHFDNRPNFKRYNQLFAGDKENSLAFCSWSNIQKSRREMLRPHTFPTSFSRRFQELDTIILNKMPELLDHFVEKSDSQQNTVELKSLILHTCGNIFMEYFASRHFAWNDKAFSKLIQNYDEVFYEVNQGYAADFIPFLLPLHYQRFKHLANCSKEIREFIVNKVIEERYDNYEINSTINQDYVDVLINHVKANKTPKMDLDTALFALEDIIGGHSAVGNFLMKVLTFLVLNPEVQVKIQQEIDECLKNKRDDMNYYKITKPEVDIFRSEHEDAYIATENENLNQQQQNAFEYEDTTMNKKSTPDMDANVNAARQDIFENEINQFETISIKDKNSMPYAEAVILESIRLIASPIVPHVANQDSSIGGYKVPKDTLVFLNNYELNMSDKLWTNPNQFQPERFIKGGRIQKPDYFLPFGGGKRSCMGYKLVQLITFGILTNLLQKYTLKPASNIKYKVPIGNLALEANKKFYFSFEQRQR